MKLTLDSINNINVFERLSGAKVKDCIKEEGRLIFLVEEGQVKRALGNNNFNLERVGKVMKKKIKIVAFNSDVCKFVRNLIYPNKADDIKLDDKVVVVSVSDSIVKGRIFGRSRENLKKINDLVRNYFDVKEVRVV